jgi:hypothetical protein
VNPTRQRIVERLMAAIGWIALGTLCTKVLAESSALSDVLNYTTMAIGVCASCAALVAASNRLSKAKLADEVLLGEVAAVKSMAEETRFSESRIRLLALAKRMEKHDSAR